jgi:microcystin-dependent protein
MHRIDGPGAAPGGLFTEGDPNVGTPATVVTDDWLNAVQTEMESVVTGSGLALAKPDNTQLLQAVRRLIALAVPPGKLGYFGTSGAPAGWLLCDGSAVSRAAYPALFTAIGTLWGAGDGSTTFNLPDGRGEFLRGADQGRGVDVGRAVGTSQAGEIQSHGHRAYTGLSDGSFGSLRSSMQTVDNGAAYRTNQAGQPTFIEATGGTETRPRNLAALLCIKA